MSAEVLRRFRRLSRYMLVFTPPLMLILNFLPIETEPWVWVKTAILGVAVIVLIVWVIRFSLWQRDE